MAIKWIKTIWHAIHSRNWVAMRRTKIYMEKWLNETSELKRKKTCWIHAEMENRNIIVFSVNVMVSLFVVPSMTVESSWSSKNGRVTFKVVSNPFFYLFPEIDRRHHEYRRSNERSEFILLLRLSLFLQISRQIQRLFTVNSIKSLAPTHSLQSCKQFAPFLSQTHSASLFFTILLQF